MKTYDKKQQIKMKERKKELDKLSSNLVQDCLYYIYIV